MKYSASGSRFGIAAGEVEQPGAFEVPLRVLLGRANIEKDRVIVDLDGAGSARRVRAGRAGRQAEQQGDRGDGDGDGAAHGAAPFFSGFVVVMRGGRGALPARARTRHRERDADERPRDGGRGEAQHDGPVELHREEVAAEPRERLHDDHEQRGADGHRHGQPAEQVERGEDEEAAAGADEPCGDADEEAVEQDPRHRQTPRRPRVVVAALPAVAVTIIMAANRIMSTAPGMKPPRIPPAKAPAMPAAPNSRLVFQRTLPARACPIMPTALVVPTMNSEAAIAARGSMPST